MIPTQMWRNAEHIIALCDAREICVQLPNANCAKFLGIDDSMIDQDRVDIVLPRLRTLELYQVHDRQFRRPEVAIDCPELEKLHVYCDHPGWDYSLFTVRAPRLRHLTWRNQFAERVDLHLGRPSSVSSGLIEFTVDASPDPDCRKMEEFRDLMMRLLRGILPELTKDGVADAARSGDRPPLPVPSLISCVLRG